MNRQYFVSYAAQVPDSDEPLFGWEVISRNNPIETDEDLKDVQRELLKKLKGYASIRIINWRRMEQE